MLPLTAGYVSLGTEFYVPDNLVRISADAERQIQAAGIQLVRTDPVFALGQEERALSAFRAAAHDADKRMVESVRIDYFATSLPNFLLFDDDLDKRNRVECLHQRAMARLGLGLTADAAGDFRSVLELERSHFGAGMELARLESSEEVTSAE
jgi:hypothetical protein